MAQNEFQITFALLWRKRGNLGGKIDEDNVELVPYCRSKLGRTFSHRNMSDTHPKDIFL